MTKKKKGMLVLDFGQIKFDKRRHVYKVGQDKLTSVTTWVKSFFTPFDEKAVAKRLSFLAKNRGEMKSPKQYMKEWKIKRDDGTKIHEALDRLVKGEIQPLEFALLPPRAQQGGMALKTIGTEKDEILYSELMIADTNIKIAGTIDLMVLKGKKFKLYDWKTSDKINDKGYTKPKHPVMKDEQDCNLTHYTLQLSTYAYILENSMTGFTCDGLAILQLQEDKCNVIDVPYRKDKIEEMLRYDKRID